MTKQAFALVLAGLGLALSACGGAAPEPKACDAPGTEQKMEREQPAEPMGDEAGEAEQSAETKAGEVPAKPAEEKK
jgi:hypothetical protein